MLLTGLVSLMFADLLWRTGWSHVAHVLLVLFVILFFLTAIGCMHGVYGFVLRADRRPPPHHAAGRLSDPEHRRHQHRHCLPDLQRRMWPAFSKACAPLTSRCERTGQLERFDFFILSDSTEPDKWVEEERRWCDLVRELDALGRIYYRRRLVNEGKKSGNVRDFLNTWGRRYRYFIVLRCGQHHARRNDSWIW